nr:hypothetical protein [Tanacetum cinerariifolium]
MTPPKIMSCHQRINDMVMGVTSCKSKSQNSISQPLFTLHMDLSGPTFVSSLMHKKYGLVVTNDYSRYAWVFFLASKDETSGILKKFITEIKNLVDKKVKVIRCDNRTEFKNSVINDFYEMKADSKLPTTFWAEAVNTACYVQNRVLVVKLHNKTPYELFRGRVYALSFMRPFGCHVTILNTLDHLGKFDGKSDDGFFVRCSLNSKAFRVYNLRTKKVEKNLHIRFLEDKPSIAGNGPKWLFDIDVLTKSMNYVPVVVDGSLFDSSSKNASNDEPQPSSDVGHLMMKRLLHPVLTAGVEVSTAATTTEVARNLEAQMEAELEKEDRLARKEEETSIALIESYDNTQAMTDVDYELAARL